MVITDTNQQSFSDSRGNVGMSPPHLNIEDNEASNNDVSTITSYDTDSSSNLIDNTEQINPIANPAFAHPSSIVTVNNVISVTTPSLQLLPNEILGLILHHLTIQQKDTLHQCALVNKQFHAIAIPLLWKTFNFDYNSNRTERFLAVVSTVPQQRLATLAQHIRRLHLHGTFWTDAHLTRLLPHTIHLDHVMIDQAIHITDASFQLIPRHCPSLTRLDLYETGLPESSFSVIGQYCHQLSELTWYVEKTQSPEWLEMLLPCPLQRLHISSWRIPLDTNAVAIIKKFDRLMDLRIKNGRRGHIQSWLLVSAPLDAGTWWPQLTKLVLGPCHDMDEQAWIGFLKSHPYLQHIELLWAPTLTDTSLDAMARWLPTLTSVTLMESVNISPHGVKQMVQACPPSLESLQLVRCNRLVIPTFAFPESTVERKGARCPTVVLDQKALEKIKQKQMQ